MKSKENLLRKLLECEEDPKKLSNELSDFDWDSQLEIIVLKREHLKNLFEGYLNGDLNKDYIENWSNVIEGREDIGYEEEFEEQIKDVIFQLANPDINKQISRDVIKKQLTELYRN